MDSIGQTLHSASYGYCYEKTRAARGLVALAVAVYVTANARHLIVSLIAVATDPVP